MWMSQMYLIIRQSAHEETSLTVSSTEISKWQVHSKEYDIQSTMSLSAIQPSSYIKGLLKKMWRISFCKSSVGNNNILHNWDQCETIFLLPSFWDLIVFSITDPLKMETTKMNKVRRKLYLTSKDVMLNNLRDILALCPFALISVIPFVSFWETSPIRTSTFLR